jgi:hypothetical protein
VSETPSGTFESSPKWIGNTAEETISELIVERIPIGNVVKEFISNSVVAEQVTDLIKVGIDEAIGKIIDNALPSWGLPGSQTIPLTATTTSLEYDLSTVTGLNTIVNISGLTVSPIASQVGQTTLNFDTSAFRMLDPNGNETSYPYQVSGNKLPISVGVPQVTVSPSTAAIATGRTQQFTATVQGNSNTSVNWSVNGVAGGNSTVGTVTDQGLYTAPATPISVSVTATSQAYTNSTASATVTVTDQYSVLITEPATNVSNTGVTLNASVNQTGLTTTPTVFFWGKSTDNWPQSAILATAQLTLGGAYAILLNLAPNTTYFFQAVGQNNAGITYGNILSFTTTP